MSGSPPPLQAWVQRVALLGPGLPDWVTALEVLRDEREYAPVRTVIPATAPLPGADRRRAGRVVRLALACAQQAAGEEAGDAPAVFASSGADGDNCDALCAALASPLRELSPTRFMNSVHNAAAGYWSIAAGSVAATTSLSAHDGTFGAGFLEALCQLRAGAARVLLVVYDADYPPPLRQVRPIPDAFAVAMLLSREPGSAAIAGLRATLVAAPATRIAAAALEALRTDVPAARVLPLLALLARGASGGCVLEYLDGLQLAVDVQRT